MRAIDADALKTDLNHETFFVGMDLYDVCRVINRQPTIEPRCETCEAFNKTRLLIPQPQRTGRWISVFDEDEDKCSECQATFFCASTRFNFCPHCGARMEGE